MGAQATIAEIDGMWERAVAAAGACGIDTRTWVLQAPGVGSGAAWRMSSRDPRTGGLSDVIGGAGWLGNTRNQAKDTLWSMARAWEAVYEHGRQ